MKSSTNDSNERYRSIIGNGSIMINNKKVTFNDKKATEDSRAERIRFGSVDKDINPMMPHRVSTSNRYGPLSYEDDNDEIQMPVLGRVEPVAHQRVDVAAVARQHRQYDSTGRYMRLTCTSDSGAGESVLPKNWFPEVESRKSEEHNTSYAAADGTLLAHGGKKTFNGLTTSGIRR